MKQSLKIARPCLDRICRSSILLAGVLGITSSIVTFAASEFWNSKPPSEWSDKELKRLLTNSPWAKEVQPQMNFSGGPNSGTPGGGLPPGGPGGRGMGGPGGGGPGGPGGGGGFGGPDSPPSQFPEIKAEVRWESAAPIRDGSKDQLSRESSDCYVLSISGLPAGGPGGVRRGDASNGANEQEGNLKQAASLQRKGKDPIAPARVSISGNGTMFFYFSCESSAISSEDKEVVFQLRTGPIELKTRFLLKDMIYQGKLAL